MDRYEREFNTAIAVAYEQWWWDNMSKLHGAE